MKVRDLFCLGLLLGFAAALNAQDRVPAGGVKPGKDRSTERLSSALRTMRQALRDLPAGADADTIRGALDRLQKRLLEDLEGRIRLAESDVEMWQDRAAWSERMAKRGFVSQRQVEADRVRLKTAAGTLDRLRELRETAAKVGGPEDPPRK